MNVHSLPTGMLTVDIFQLLNSLLTVMAIVHALVMFGKFLYLYVDDDGTFVHTQMMSCDWYLLPSLRKVLLQEIWLIFAATFQFFVFPGLVLWYQ